MRAANKRTVIDRATEASDLLDRRYFLVTEGAFKRLNAMLDRPSKENPKLRRLLGTRPPWEKHLGIL